MLVQKSTKIPRYQFEILANNKEIQENYNVVVRNRFEGLQEAEDMNIYWQQISDIITESAKETISTKELKAKQNWMTTEIVELMADRRIAKQCQVSQKYKEKDRMIRKKCIAAKEKWFNDKYEEIELLAQKNPQLIHEKVKNLSKPKRCTSSGCIKGKDGSITMDKEKILNRW